MKPRNNYLLTTKTKYIVSMLERLYYQSHIELLHARATMKISDTLWKHKHKQLINIRVSCKQIQKTITSEMPNKTELIMCWT
jgi:hypothetical protein